MARRVTVTPQFADTSSGRLLLVWFEPGQQESSGHTVVILPPFGEELNKSRRMIAEQARSLASMGTSVVVPDLFGTGDSQGDFTDATFDIWKANMHWVIDLVDSNDVGQGYSLLAIRFGALLLAELDALHIARSKQILLWNAYIDGKLFLRQLLRTRLASQMLLNQEDKESIEDLLSMLQSGSAVDVGGYTLSPDLVLAIQSTSLSQMCRAKVASVRGFELSKRQGAQVSVGAQKFFDRIRLDGVDASVEAVMGDKFWATTETVVVRELITRTTAAFANA